MKRKTLENATVDELVERFVDLCIAQDREIMGGDVKQINRIYDKIVTIRQELKARPGDQRCALIPLYRHENMQVRLVAAQATLAVAPEAARRALEAIAASKEQPQCGEASHSLWNLDRGVFKPT
jgi:hypothetical protein